MPVATWLLACKRKTAELIMIRAFNKMKDRFGNKIVNAVAQYF